MSPPPPGCCRNSTSGAARAAPPGAPLLKACGFFLPDPGRRCENLPAWRQGGIDAGAVKGVAFSRCAAVRAGSIPPGVPPGGTGRPAGRVDRLRLNLWPEEREVLNDQNASNAKTLWLVVFFAVNLSGIAFAWKYVSLAIASLLQPTLSDTVVGVFAVGAVTVAGEGLLALATAIFASKVRNAFPWQVLLILVLLPTAGLVVGMVIVAWGLIHS